MPSPSNQNLFSGESENPGETPVPPPAPRKTLFELWGVTPDELAEAAQENPSLNGLLMGYVAEIQLKRMIEASEHVTDSNKHDDHDRKNKGDRVIVYKGHRVNIESKSLQSTLIKDLGNDQWSGKTQVDGSDKAGVILPDGSVINTTCLPYNTFDVLAVNCFLFGHQWRWQFCRNSELRNSPSKKYTDYQRQNLMATMHNVTWPVTPPFRTDLWELLDEMIERGELPRAD
jgi:hypothetical protein